MEKNKIERGYVCYDKEKNQIVTSDPFFDEIADGLANNKRDYNKHEGVFFQVSPRTKSLMIVNVHNTTRGPSAGGLRFWPYENVHSILTDGLRLSQGMGRKNSCAGLFWGGGKGVIARSNPTYFQDKEWRQSLFQDWGLFISSIQGCHYTAEDAGTVPEDISNVFSRTRFVTCIPKAFGGSGNPSTATAHGVVCAMEAALDHLKMGSLQGKTVAVQGLGNVATPMIEKLVKSGVKKVYANDINPAHVERAKQLFKDAPVEISLVSPTDTSIFSLPVDIFAPCALGGILNEFTIPLIQAKIVCGASNNQLLDDQVDDKRLADRNILYIPDYVANRMGIVNCANEEAGYVSNDSSFTRHFNKDWEYSIYNMTMKILAHSKQHNLTTAQAANYMADELQKIDHPIWPGRSRQIINTLRETKWQNKKLYALY